MGLDSMLYNVARAAGKAASVANDGKLLSQGKVDAVVKKKLKAKAYKGLGQFLKGF